MKLTDKYLTWVKQADLPPLTGNQVKMALVLLELEEMALVGDFTKVFKSIRKFNRT